MGCGLYSYDTAVSRGVARKKESRERIFQSRSLFSEMNIKGKVRECCETTEHPTTLPIIIGLDVTGSMGFIPEVLIKEKLPMIVKAVKEAGIEHPEICFCAFGDDIYDEAPIQVGQFESSDELIEKWLTHTWLEGGGGGNGQESPNLIHYFAAHHTSCDAFKRNQKGVLITISDEKCAMVTSKHTIKALFDDDVEADVKSDDIIGICSEHWNIFHIDIDDYTSRRLSACAHWKELLGENNVKSVPKTDHMDELIPAIVSCITSTAVGETVAIPKEVKESVVESSTINML